MKITIATPGARINSQVVMGIEALFEVIRSGVKVWQFSAGDQSRGIEAGTYLCDKQGTSYCSSCTNGASYERGQSIWEVFEELDMTENRWEFFGGIWEHTT